MKNNQKTLSVLKVTTLICTFSLLTSCTFAPGMQVSGVLEKSAIDTLNSSQEMTDEQRTQQEAIPQYFTTPAGVNIAFSSLNKLNIPQVPQISQNNVKVIRDLLRTPKQTEYKIATGDSIAINLWSYPQIFGSVGSGNTRNVFTISQSGKVFLPLIGSVTAKGKTQAQLRRELSNRYAKYLKQPEVDLKIVKFNGRFYSVEGKVKAPGEFVINQRPTSLMTALSKSGGLTENADSHSVTLTRRGTNYQFGLPELRAMGIPASKIFLQDGDAVHIGSNDNRKVYLIGEVGKSTYLTIPESGLSLANALGASQGVNSQTANPAKIYVVRSQNNRNLTNVYRLDLSKLENITLANDFRMLPNDLVYVDATGLTRWNRILTQIIPSTGLIRSGQVITGN